MLNFKKKFEDIILELVELKKELDDMKKYSWF